MSKEKHTFYIVDAHAQLWRSYYARMADLQSPAGEPTKAVYGFLQMFQRLMRVQKPTWVAVAFDTHTENLKRRKLSPLYKAGRKKEDISGQIRRTEQILQAQGIVCLRAEEYEADDIMATLVDSVKGIKDIEVVLVAKDKDLHQLVSDQVSMYDPGTDERMYLPAVAEKWRVAPHLIADVQALSGDPTDGIRGLPGIGPAIAAECIREAGSLDALLKNPAKYMHLRAAKIIMKNPKASKQAIELSRQLVTLYKNVPLDDIDTDNLECDTHFEWTSKARTILDDLGIVTL